MGMCRWKADDIRAAHRFQKDVGDGVRFNLLYAGAGFLGVMIGDVISVLSFWRRNKPQHH